MSNWALLYTGVTGVLVFISFTGYEQQISRASILSGLGKSYVEVDRRNRVCTRNGLVQSSWVQWTDWVWPHWEPDRFITFLQKWGSPEEGRACSMQHCSAICWAVPFTSKTSQSFRIGHIHFIFHCKNWVKQIQNTSVLILYQKKSGDLRIACLS